MLLKILLSIYGVADIAILTFLYMQYKMLVKSEEYTTDSLMNKFIVGFLAIGGMLLIVALFLATGYFIFQ